MEGRPQGGPAEPGGDLYVDPVDATAEYVIVLDGGRAAARLDDVVKTLEVDVCCRKFAVECLRREDTVSEALETLEKETNLYVS